MLDVPELIRCVLLCRLEVVDGELCLLEVVEVMRSVLLRMLEAVEGVLCLLEDVGGARGAGGDALCALCSLEAIEGRLCLLEVMRCVLLCMLEGRSGSLDVLDVPKMMPCVLFCILEAALFTGVGGDGRAGRAGDDAPCVLCMLEAVDGVLCLLDDVGRAEGAGGAGGDALRTLCTLEAVEGGLCLLAVLEVLEMLEAMQCVLPCMLEGRLCLPGVLDVPKMMRCVLFRILEAALFTGGVEGDGRDGRAGRTGHAGGDALCTTLYARRSFGGLETRSTRADMELCRHGATELWSRAVEGRLCLLEVPEVIRCVLLCTLETVEGRVCLLEVLEVPEVLDAVEGAGGFPHPSESSVGELLSNDVNYFFY